MVHRAWLLWVRQRISSSSVVDRDETFFDVDIWRSILAHRAKLDELAIGAIIGNGVDHVERTNDVVDLGEDSMAAINHRVGRRALLAVVDDSIWLKATYHRFNKGVIHQVANVGRDSFI